MQENSSSTLSDITKSIKNLINTNDNKRILEFITEGDILVNTGNCDTMEMVEYWNVKADFHNNNKDFENAALNYESALNIVSSLNKSNILALLLVKYASTMRRASKYKEAYDAFKKARSLFTELNDGFGLIRTTLAMGEICNIQGNFELSIKLLEEALDFETMNSDTNLQASIFQGLGKSYFLISDFDSAMSYYNKCAELISFDNINMRSLLESQIGEIYSSQGDLHTALSHQMRALQMRQELKDKDRSIALSQMSIGNIYEKMGELNLSYENYIIALKIFEKEKDELNIAKSYANLGKVLYKQGELIKSLEFLTDSLRLQEKMGLKANSGEIYNLIGEIYYNQKSFEKAINYQNRAVASYLEMNNSTTIIYPYFSLLMVSLALNDNGLQTSFFQLIEGLYREHPDNQLIEVHFKMADAMLMKNSGRRMKIGKAEIIFDEIIHSTIIDHKLVILASQQKCDLLIDELKTTTIEEEIIDEIISINEKLKVIAMNQKSYILSVETMLLESILSLLQGDLDYTEELLDNAQLMAEEKNLSFLVEKINFRKNIFQRDYDDWEKISGIKMSIRDKLKFKKVANFLESSQKILFDPFTSSVTEHPTLIMIMNKSGLVYFSFKFDVEDEINEHLIAAFLSAMNSFSQDAFTSGSGTYLNQISYQNRTITSKKHNDLLYYYIYTSIALNPGKKLEQLIEYFDTSVPEFHEIIEKNLPTTVAVTVEQLEEIKAIFLEE